MIKTIKIDKKTSLKLDNNVEWMLIYRDQFGKDIVPMLIPAVNAGINIAMSVARETAGAKDIRDALASMSPEEITSALYELAGFEMADVINVTWSMAKCADETIDEPRAWVRQFEVFPLDAIAPAVVELVAKGLMTTKNFARLQAAVDSLKSLSTASSSQDSEEDSTTKQ